MLLIFCTSNANAKKRRNEKYVFGVTMFYDHTRGDSLVPLDSIKHLIDTKQIDYLFLPNNPLVGLHLNALVQGGNSNAPTEASFFPYLWMADMVV